MKKTDWKGRFRGALIVIIIVIGIIYGFTHIKIQSRDSYQKEKEELAVQIEKDNEESSLEENSNEDNKEIQVTLSISCENLMEDKSQLTNKSLIAYLPEDGIILTTASIKLEKKSTVYTALEKICMAEGIQMESDFTPIYNTYYVKGIGSLYEKDAGEKSGWIYMVNGETANMGASSYILEDGDEIQWVYTCRLGE